MGKGGKDATRRDCSKANPDAYFTVDCTANITRNNGYKIIGKHFETNEAKYFFFILVTNAWNELPLNVVNPATVETFKKHLNNYSISNPQLALFSSG